MRALHTFRPRDQIWCNEARTSGDGSRGKSPLADRQKSEAKRAKSTSISLPMEQLPCDAPSHSHTYRVHLSHFLITATGIYMFLPVVLAIFLCCLRRWLVRGRRTGGISIEHMLLSFRHICNRYRRSRLKGGGKKRLAEMKCQRKRGKYYCFIPISD